MAWTNSYMLAQDSNHAQCINMCLCDLHLVRANSLVRKGSRVPNTHPTSAPPPAAIQDPRSEGISTCREKTPSPHTGVSLHAPPTCMPSTLAFNPANSKTHTPHPTLHTPHPTPHTPRPTVQEEEVPVAKKGKNVKVSDKNKGAPSWKELGGCYGRARVCC